MIGRLRAGVVGSVLLAVAVAGPLSGQGVALAVGPEISTLRWDDELGLSDATLYGASTTIEFGRFVALRGSWGRARDIEARFDPRLFGITGGRFDLDLASTAVRLRLGSRTLGPLLLGGGGLATFRPEGRSSTQEIFVSWGGGLEVRNDWGALQLAVLDTRMRVDRALLTTDPPAAADPDAGRLRSSLRATLSGGIRIGGRPADDRTRTIDERLGGLLRGDLGGLMIPIEARGGFIRFDEALDLAEQPMAGLRGGVDLGPYFGLRAHWFRGIERDGEGVAFDGLVGEAQFNLGRVTSASPFLLLGYGNIDFADDARNRAGGAVRDQDLLVVGAGFGVPLSDRSRLSVALRDYIATAGELDIPDSPSDLRHSPSLDVGLSVLLFGRRTEPAAGRPSPAAPSPGAVGARTDPAAEGDRATGTSTTGSDASASAVADSTTSDGSYHSDRSVTLPIPTEGELYIRYGPGRAGEVGLPLDSLGRLDRDALRAMIREELTALVGDSASSPEVRALELRIAELADRIGDGGGSAATEEQLRQLSGIVRETVSLSPTILTSVNVAPAEASGAGEPGVGFFRGAQARTGTSSLDGTGAGIGLSIDALVLDRVLGWLQPYFGLEAGRASVATTRGASSVLGHTSSVGIRGGVTTELPRVGPVRPALQLGTVALAGSNSGRTAQDGELLDEIYGTRSVGVEWGAQVALGTSDERFRLLGAVRRLMAGSRSRWAVEVGVRWTPAPPAPPSDPEPVLDRVEAAEERLLERLDRLEAAIDSTAEARAAAREESAPTAAAPDTAAADPVVPAEDTVAADPEVAPPVAVVPLPVGPSLLESLRIVAGQQQGRIAVREEARGIVVEVAGGSFATGSWLLDAEARAAVTAVGAILREQRGLEIVVEGHTDAVGDPVRNRALSQSRAEEVRAALLAAGVSPRAVEAIGTGAAAPRASNDTAEGRAANRRVEILIPGAGG